MMGLCSKRGEESIRMVYDRTGNYTTQGEASFAVNKFANGGMGAKVEERTGWLVDGYGGIGGDGGIGGP